MAGLKWMPNILAEARTLAEQAEVSAFPIELDCAPGIYVALIDDPKILAGNAFEVAGQYFKVGPMLDEYAGR